MQRQVAIRPRILQPLRRLRQIHPHLCQQIRPAEIELVAQLQHLLLGVVRSQRQREPRRRVARKVRANSLETTTKPAAFAAASTCPANTVCVPILICLKSSFFRDISILRPCTRVKRATKGCLTKRQARRLGKIRASTLRLPYQHGPNPSTRNSSAPGLLALIAGPSAAQVCQAKMAIVSSTQSSACTTF